MSDAPEEAVGASFNLQRLEQARARTQAAVAEMASRFSVGMAETEARRIAAAVLEEANAEKGWHPILVRFGPNTIKAFKEPSEDGVALRPLDIFFIDIGPVFDGHEGDFGRTFVVGEDPTLTRCARDAETIFGEAQAHWRKTGATGRALYDFAEQRAHSRGWELNRGQGQGHRISEFPHAVHHRGKLADFDGNPIGDRWILEIALRHPTEPFGSFFEDLLR